MYSAKHISHLIAELNQAIQSKDWLRISKVGPDILNIHPDHAQVWAAYGLALKHQHQYEAAENALLKASYIETKSEPIKNNLASVWIRLGKWREAAKVCEDILGKQPGSKTALLNLSAAYLRGRNPERSYELLSTHIKSDCDDADLWANFATAAQKINLHEEAVRYNNNSLRLKQDPSIEFNQAILLLQMGKYEEGLELVESRWDSLSFQQLGQKLPDIPYTRWSGENLAGKKILVGSEQGLGDTLQFSRFLKELAGQSPKKIQLITQKPLGKLLAHSLGDAVDVITENHDVDPEYDYFIPLMSVLRIVRVRAENLPYHVNYIQPDSQAVEKWAIKKQDKKYIGICWLGSDVFQDDDVRSIPAEYFRALVELYPKYIWVNLKKGSDLYDGVSVPSNYINPMFGVKDFMDTAGIINNLDLVITVDTSVVHLSGAMGAKTYMLNRFGSEWRWFTNRVDSPWYPSVTIFNQKTIGDWHSVMQEISEALRDI